MSSPESTTAELPDELLIVEDLALLLADDRSGTPAAATALYYTLGGAVLAELALLGAVEAEKGSWLTGTQVRVVGASPEHPGEQTPELADPLLSDALAKLEGKPKGVQSALATLGSGLWEVIVERLLQRGLLSEEESRFLGIFPTTKHPATDNAYEPALRARVADVLENGADADERTAAIVAMLSASGALPSLDPHPRWSGAVQKRGKEFEEGNWGASAASSAVAQTTAAIVSAGVAATIAASTTATTN